MSDVDHTFDKEVVVGELLRDLKSTVDLGGMSEMDRSMLLVQMVTHETRLLDAVKLKFLQQVAEKYLHEEGIPFGKAHQKHTVE